MGGGGMMSGYSGMPQAGMYGAHAQSQQPQQNDRPFKCDQCPQSFNRNHDLKRHKRIHLAVKPFPCGHCEKSFSRKDALKVCRPFLSTSCLHPAGRTTSLHLPNSADSSLPQRHILVKGCGKMHATGGKADGSSSPGDKADGGSSDEPEESPVLDGVAATPA